MMPLWLQVVEGLEQQRWLCQTFYLALKNMKYVFVPSPAKDNKIYKSQIALCTMVSSLGQLLEAAALERKVYLFMLLK